MWMVVVMNGGIANELNKNLNFLCKICIFLQLFSDGARSWPAKKK